MLMALMTKYIPNGRMKRFIEMSKIITYDSQGNDITCVKEFHALKYPCQECGSEDCEERENYEKTDNRK